MPQATKRVGFAGERYGRCVVLGEAEATPSGRAVLCRCDCGNIKTIDLGSLRRGLVHSCGCLRSETVRSRVETHGMTGSPEYRAWRSMIACCENPSNRNYRYYDALGIGVDARWRRDFSAFFAEVGPRPSPAHILDRIDKKRGYESGNVRWATRSEQRRNSCRTHILELDGRKQSIAAWADELGVSARVLHGRLGMGWDVRRTLTTPKRRHAKESRKRDP